VDSKGDELPNFTGQLLVAHPSLRDPNFRRTILFISSHDPVDGAHGLVINRPTNKSVGDFLPNEELKLFEHVPVYVGGPVGDQELTIASFQWSAGSAKILFHAPGSFETLEQLTDVDLNSLRAFVGYAGWTGGQLEFELGQSAWLVLPPSQEIFDKAGEPAWLEVMKNLGPAYYLLASAPDDPSLN
jgi:putative transcriptional regulator